MSVEPTTAPGRLTDSRDIVAVLQGGRRRAGRLVVLHIRSDTRGADTIVAGTIARNATEVGDVTDGNATAGTVGDHIERPEPRVAVVASRKVGGAVNRNRAKRLLREAARRVAWVPGTDVVVVARNGCAASTMPVVLHELEELASQLRVTRNAA